MKVEYKRNSIEIIPENEQDEVYLEAITGCKHKGDKAIAERIAPFDFDHDWAYLEIKKEAK